MDAEPGKLTVRHTVEEIIRDPLTIRVKPVIETRRAGHVTVRMFAAPLGGTCLVTGSTPQRMSERCQKAALELGRWQRRYTDALAYSGIEDDAMTELVELLAKG